MWHLCGLHSEAMGTTLLFLRRADGRHPKNDTNGSVWPKGNSGDKDTGPCSFFRTKVSCRGGVGCDRTPLRGQGGPSQRRHVVPRPPFTEACLGLGSQPTKRLGGVSCDKHSADQRPSEVTGQLSELQRAGPEFLPSHWVLF